MNKLGYGSFKMQNSAPPRSPVEPGDFYKVEGLHRKWIESNGKEGSHANLMSKDLTVLHCETPYNVCLYGANLMGAYINNDRERAIIDVRYANRFLLESTRPLNVFTAGLTECQAVFDGVLVYDHHINAGLLKDLNVDEMVELYGKEVAVIRNQLIFGCASAGVCSHPRQGDNKAWLNALNSLIQK